MLFFKIVFVMCVWICLYLYLLEDLVSDFIHRLFYDGIDWSRDWLIILLLDIGFTVSIAILIF